MTSKQGGGELSVHTGRKRSQKKAHEFADLIIRHALGDFRPDDVDDLLAGKHIPDTVTSEHNKFIIWRVLSLGDLRVSCRREKRKKEEKEEKENWHGEN